MTSEVWRFQYECARGHKWARYVTEERYTIPEGVYETACLFCGATVHNPRHDHRNTALTGSVTVCPPPTSSKTKTENYALNS